jgi:hypothetical protein
MILQDAEQFFATQKLRNVKFTHHTGFLVDSFQEFEALADLVMLDSLGKESTAPDPRHSCLSLAKNRLPITCD